MIADGTGSCAQGGTTDSTSFYCAYGENCNNFEGKTCWDPASNAEVATACTSSQWQCKVSNNFYYFLHSLITKILEEKIASLKSSFIFYFIKDFDR